MTSKPSSKEILRKIGLTNSQKAGLDLLSSTELGFIDGITAGTATASKALVLNSSKGISTITSATITTLTSTTANATTLNAGADASAGTVNSFPSTTASGKLILAAVNSAGAFNTTISNASMGQSSVVSIPDPGAATAKFLLDTGTNTAATITTISGTTANYPAVNVGASGTVGALKIFPTTASKGDLKFTCSDQTGNTEVIVNAAAMAQATTFTLPDPGTSTSNILTSKGVGGGLTVITTGAVTANGTTTYANVTGLSQTVVPGTYKFKLILPSTVASGTGGIKYCFNYTTTVLSSIESTSKGYTASAVAVQHTTTTTTQTDLFTQAAVVILTEVEGIFVVGTGGTIDVQMAQNTSNGSNTIALINGQFILSRTA